MEDEVLEDEENREKCRTEVARHELVLFIRFPLESEVFVIIDQSIPGKQRALDETYTRVENRVTAPPHPPPPSSIE